MDLRVFSNFVNLVELHLTDAFADNTPEDLAADLHDIFVNSELQELRKLHLEQNEISQFKDPKVFCDLPNLQDLHLGKWRPFSVLYTCSLFVPYENFV